MKFTLSWLKDHLETDATLDQIVEKLTDIGLEVDGVDDRAAFRAFKVAKVLTAVQHPDADKLRVLSVDTGEGQPVQVVCGAPNARAGLVGVLGRPGDYVPGLDVTLSVGKIRGVESFGMMCSERELELSDEHNGIIDLPDDVPVGTSFAAYMGLDDPIIEIGLTPNRADCTGIRGIARDLAAAGLGTLKNTLPEVVKGEGEAPVKVILDQDTENPFCTGFALRMVKGVKNGPSPKWMQQRLKAIGLRPINALVDITNYVTFDQGRPLHVFDAAKVKGNLTVRAAKDGETILGLDQREYKFKPGMYVIADENGPESIAGIMGGEHSGCDENTVDVLIESALWDPRMIARTGRELGIVTDARYRFERGVDPEMMIPGAEIATKLVLELCGGQPTVLDVVGYTAPTARVIDFPVAEVKRLTGIDVSYDASFDILKRLGFGAEGDGKVIKATVPTWRGDVEGKADLVEEVMRIHGINQIEPQPLPGLGTVNGRILTTLQIRTRLARRTLASRGMMEAVTYSFISEAQAKAFGGGKPELKLANPIAADMSDMRPSLLPGLLAAAQRNADRGFGDTALFEVSGIYEGDKPEQQRRVAGGVRRGTAGVEGSGRFWSGNAAPVGVFDAKADALAALEAAGAPVDRIQIEAGGPEWFHPGRSGTLKLGPKVVLGYFGEFHPDTLEALDVSGTLCGFEVYIDAIPEPKAKATRTKPALSLSQFQSLKRDFAFVVDASVEAGNVVKAVSSADKKLIAGVQVFDVFTGASLGEGKKSIAVEVLLQPQDRTLTDEDLEALAKQVIANVTKQTGGVLRG
ncbi:phenylalanine--tRNA ligase subunit beta [Brucella pseudogrignonensis]|uniref:phenylalanine--tRNA ligase subunit beta n=1 Tax=Brucella pseudogrignonensis TaxID=419475 RepID=UPI000CFAC7FE|nr:phenylalanine--tRNA ligase subunit beta [Brucella pseudogrignonensis]MQP39934.1 phenylalanine--tRNA ligase subunit beta [Ochrobactrum sp. MYb237]PQZ44455.1 phenylalanine--tRNA ligase subunit beta [Brucella pseudogrignonensis]PRA41764.1 phenylalanine--tRNA ligase subunit beta [Brucella pseudogrignonensis]PRA70809.1 phenylalanine--tRNA ligase subunit beta [Brucella pseudogrignonensis]